MQYPSIDYSCSPGMSFLSPRLQELFNLAANEGDELKKKLIFERICEVRRNAL